MHFFVVAGCNLEMIYLLCVAFTFSAPFYYYYHYYLKEKYLSHKMYHM